MHVWQTNQLFAVSLTCQYCLAVWPLISESTWDVHFAYQSISWCINNWQGPWRHDLFRSTKLKAEPARWEVQRKASGLARAILTSQVIRSTTGLIGGTQNNWYCMCLLLLKTVSPQPSDEVIFRGCERWKKIDVFWYFSRLDEMRSFFNEWKLFVMRKSHFRPGTQYAREVFSVSAIWDHYKYERS